MANPTIDFMDEIDKIIGDMKRDHPVSNITLVHSCPACGGKLWVTLNGTKRHSRGHCDTKECISWIE